MDAGDGSTQDRRLTRRTFLTATGAVVGVGAAGAIGWQAVPNRFKRAVGLGEEPPAPDVPNGTITLESVRSDARGMEVDFFTAVPAGHGDGAGLPVVVILHGATGRPGDYEAYGIGRFLTQAVRDGAQPFVLAGADGGTLRWEEDPASDDDPQTMLFDEIPVWLGDRGFAPDRPGLWGWSMGGYGVLSAAERRPRWPSAVASFSPAMSTADLVFSSGADLADVPIGLWCGTEDGFYPAVRAFAESLTPAPEIATFTSGNHSRFYWNEHTLEAFAFLASHLG